MAVIAGSSVVGMASVAGVLARLQVLGSSSVEPRAPLLCFLLPVIS